MGPVAISIRKEKVDDRENNLGRADYGFNQFRVIVRTSEVRRRNYSTSKPNQSHVHGVDDKSYWTLYL